MSDKKEKKGEKKGGKKKGIGKIVGAILTPLLIIVLVSSMFFTILDAIIGIIKDIIIGIIENVMEFLAHPIRSIIKASYGLRNGISKLANGDFDGAGLEAVQDKQLIVIDQAEFIQMRDSLEKSINRNTAGLDDIMLKKMLLAFNKTNYSQDTDIIIELTPEERDLCDDDSSYSSPFDLKKGKEIPQLELKEIEVWKDSIVSWIDNSKKDEEIREKKEMQEKDYLHTKGSLILKNEDGEELVYYDSEVLKKLYEKEFKANEGTEFRDYAESVWEYLDKCYTDGVNGMAMYSYEKVVESMTEWSFKDKAILNFSGRINKHIKDKFSIVKERKEQNIEYCSIVSEYATPVEFMVDLMEITGSKDFINAFIEKVSKETSIEMVLYKTGYSYSDTIKEVTEETTVVKGEFKFIAKVTNYKRKYVDNEGRTQYTWTGNNGGIKLSTSMEETTTLIGKVLKRKIELDKSTINSNVTEVQVQVAGPNGLEYKYITPDSSGNWKWEDDTPWVTRYATRENDCDIIQTTTKVNSESKYDVTIKEAKTWYAHIKYDYDKKVEVLHETKDSNGDLIEVDNPNAPQPKMHAETKADEVYKKDGSASSNIIFDDSKSVAGIVAGDLGNQLEQWYGNLTSNQLAYHVTGGFLTRALYEAIDGNHYALITKEESLNIKLTYAMAEGVFDWLFRINYSPIELTCKVRSYQKGELYTTINQYIVENSPPVVTDKTDIFLSLLRNSTGIFDVNKDYVPNGIDIEYPDLYKTDTTLGKLLVNGEEMLYDLLESSPNTQRLVGVMQEIIWKYKNKTGASSGRSMNTLLNLQDLYSTGMLYRRNNG